MINFNGHPVDAKITTLTLGQNSQTANTNLSGVGNFQFDQGTVDITTVNMGVCGGNSSTLSLTNGAIGTLTVGANGTFLVNSISLGNVTSTAQGSFASGTLFINGGTATCTNDIVKTTSLLTTGTVAVATGTLYALGKIGTPSNPVDNLNVTNATVRLNVDGSGAITTNICVNSVNAGGTTTIDIAQVTGVTGLMTFPLVAYNTLNGTVAGNFTVTVPGGYYGSLVDNSAQKRIDLSIIPTVKPKPRITNISLSGTTLTIQATNGSLGGQYVLLGTTNVALPLSQWTPLLTNAFDSGGNFNLVTNIVNADDAQQFYILSQ